MPMFHGRVSGFGPTLPTSAAQRLGSYLGYTGRDADILGEAALTQSRRVSYRRCYELSRLLQALVNRLTQYDRLLLQQRNKSSSQLVVHELCNAGNRSLRFRHHAHAHVPNMPHVRPYLDLDVTAVGAHFISYSYSVVAQHFIAADENKRRRQAGRVPVKRRGVCR